MIANEKEVSHFWPFYWCQKPYQLTSWKKAKHFTYRCKKYILQFLVIKPFATLFMMTVYPLLEHNFSWAVTLPAYTANGRLRCELGGHDLHLVLALLPGALLPRTEETASALLADAQVPNYQSHAFLYFLADDRDQYA